MKGNHYSYACQALPGGALHPDLYMAFLQCSTPFSAAFLEYHLVLNKCLTGLTMSRDSLTSRNATTPVCHESVTSKNIHDTHQLGTQDTPKQPPPMGRVMGEMLRSTPLIIMVNQTNRGISNPPRGSRVPLTNSFEPLKAPGYLEDVEASTSSTKV